MLNLKDTDLLIVLVTAGSAEEAERIAGILVEDKAAACVNVIPGITSIFRWQGKLEHAAEALMICKTTAANFERLTTLVKQHHSYDTPEIVALPSAGVEVAYLGWVREAVR